MNWDITGFYGTFLGNYAPKVPIHCHNPCKTFVKQIICFWANRVRQKRYI